MTPARRLVVLGVLVAVAACESPPLADGYADGPITCSSCHGSDVNAAPPLAINGIVDESAIGVGAHQAHLRDGAISRAVACDECHVVPATVDAEGHIDGLPAEVRFGSLATSLGVEPIWEVERPSCSATYCHSGGRAGAEDPAPIWTRVDGTQARCSSCHGDPPPSPHPPSDRCVLCHSATVNAAGEILVSGGQHLDGEVDVDELTCASCHGTEPSGAPPPDLQGETSTTARGVGAHQAHLVVESDRHGPVGCQDCHVVPAAVGDPGHIDGDDVAELVWSPLASNGGLAPSFDGVGCSNIYCHGGTLRGGSATAPIWTQVDGTQATCGSCHGSPPAQGHPQRVDCASCHGEVIGPDGDFVQPALHIDGVLQVEDRGCASCHGGPTSPAPPVDIFGNNETTAAGVGAHRAHLVGSARHGPVACDACHVVPRALESVGHVDDDGLRGEVVFGALARLGELSPTYDLETLSCSNVYCHGGDEPVGPAPVWNVVDGTQAACGTCHANPPSVGHPQRADCATCHGEVIDADLVFVRPDLHVDGLQQAPSTDCDGCHGADGESAPPMDTTGGTATTLTGVGAHREHLGPSIWHKEFACDACHQVPTTNDDPGHYDSELPAELEWGLEATGGGLTNPMWDGVSCSNVACHGGALTQPGAIHPEPVWTVVDGTQRACFSCHGLPPGGDHPASFSCGTCHGEVFVGGAAFEDPERHINGVVDVSCNGCHGDDDSAAPPQDLAGNTDPSFTGVGAHRSHLAESTTHGTIECSACHVVPATYGDEGHADTPLPAELTWSALASADGVVPAFDGFTCNVYCHGASLDAGGTNVAPTWTSVGTGEAACGTCHALPPPAPHPVAPPTVCSTCHPFIGTVPIDKNRHIDGVLDAP